MDDGRKVSEPIKKQPIFIILPAVETTVLSRVPVILIFDIGKTTKKVLVFDHSFHVLEEKTEVFKEVYDDDGFPSDDLGLVSVWVREMFTSFIDHPGYLVTHCNISAYGASLVHLDGNGDWIAPFYNYLKPFPASCHKLFSDRYDPHNDVAAVTASPFLGLLNSGLQLFWMKNENSLPFRRVKTSLHLPQYFTYLITKEKFTDITSVGCHTMLWNFNLQTYHDWVTQEKLVKLFPPIKNSDHTFDFRWKNHQLRMGIGVHDSSAALMPYLATLREPFLLLSTGTWNICFNPHNKAPLTKKELEADCLCYLTYQGEPVKASRIFLGHEHERQTEALTKYFKVSSDAYKTIAFQEKIYQELTSPSAAERPFYPIGMEGTGPLPDRSEHQTDLSLFDNFLQAYHQLVRYLVRWQMISIDLVDPKKEVKNIVVVGGFTKNSLFLELLKREDPSRQVLISDHPRASALGAAWLVTGRDGYEGKEGLLKIMNS